MTGWKDKRGSDIMWYIWTAPYSPLYGRNKMATFERYFIDDDDMKIEKKNFYYDYINKPESVPAYTRGVWFA